jgi:hypothetical protein
MDLHANSVDDQIAALAASNLETLRTQFPGWQITQDGDRLVAFRPGCDPLYGRDVTEMRARLVGWAAGNR